MKYANKKYNDLYQSEYLLSTPKIIVTVIISIATSLTYGNINRNRQAVKWHEQVNQ